MKHIHTILITALLALTCAAALVSPAENPHDIVVYGGTSGGVLAAVQAARSGHTVILISPTQKLGGLTQNQGSPVEFWENGLTPAVLDAKAGDLVLFDTAT